jgi:tetratricopeptide (TPR) repeat protein
MTSASPHRDRYGNPLSTGSVLAAARYNEAIDMTLAAGPPPETLLEEAVAADEGFALAHVALARQNQFRGRMTEAREGVERALALTGGVTRRERQHVETIATAVRGDNTKALAMVKEHVAEFPTDAYILSQASGVYSLIGFGGNIDRNEEQIQLLEPLSEDYGDDWWYMSALAFAENELSRHKPARKHAERSLELFHRNGHAAHTIAHIDFETGDPEGGAGFLAGWRPGYERTAGIYGHITWHHAIFELIRGNAAEAERIYREELRPGSASSAALGLVADAASLLWRMDLAGHEGPLPWGELRDWAATAFPQPGVMFADVHCALAYAAAGDDAALGRLIGGLQKRAEAGKIPGGSVVPALAEAIAAFAHGDFDKTVSMLEPRMAEVVRIGGSHAQREVIEDTLLEAYLRSRRFDRAEALLRERLERRPSPRDTRWLARVGDERETVAALS